MEIIFFFVDKDPAQKPTFSFEFPPSFFSNSKPLGKAEGRDGGGGCHCDGETTKGTKAKKAAKGELSSPCTM